MVKEKVKPPVCPICGGIHTKDDIGRRKVSTCKEIVKTYKNQLENGRFDNNKMKGLSIALENKIKQFESYLRVNFPKEI